MKLWIRCQNRVNLLEVNHISYDERPANPFKNDYTPIHKIYGNKVLLGIYATAERCIEIIDEIQKLLYCDFATVNPNTTIKNLEEIINRKGSILHFPKEPLVEYHSASTVVYEMPEN